MFCNIELVLLCCSCYHCHRVDLFLNGFNFFVARYIGFHFCVGMFFVWWGFVIHYCNGGSDDGNILVENKSFNGNIVYRSSFIFG